MVKIRLMRLGAKKNPHYRVVVVDSRKRRGSDYIESLGYYDPRNTIEENLRIDNERAAYWLEQGAQPTETAVKLLQEVGVEIPKVLVQRTRSYKARAANAKNAPAAPKAEKPAASTEETTAASA